MTIEISDAPVRSRAKRLPKVEYWLYFALLFVILLPTAVFKRALSFFTGTQHEESVFREAVSETHTAAAMIFSA